MLGKIKKYFKMPKGSDKGNKQFYALLKSILSFASYFDPTGIAGMVKSFIHDDCPVANLSDDLERS